jgi:hypothetical protein
VICKVPGCGLDWHPGPCGVAKRKAEAAARNAQPAQVVNTQATVVNAVVNTKPVVVNESRHGKYADIDKRAAYQREWMRAKRARPVAGG